MDVFVSWSGPRSQAVAEALRGWMPHVINALNPWLSSSDIDKGARWGTDIATRLQQCQAGIICMTPENQHAPWLLFESGALSKTVSQSLVCPVLIGMAPADVAGPLAQFQSVRFENRDDMLALLKTFNAAMKHGSGSVPDSRLEEAFDVWWPRLVERADSLLVPPNEPGKARSDRELLEELLALVREQARERPDSSLIDASAPPDSRPAWQEGLYQATAQALKRFPFLAGIETTLSPAGHAEVSFRTETGTVIPPVTFRAIDGRAWTVIKTHLAKHSRCDDIHVDGGSE